MRKITMLTMLLVMALFIVPSCAPEISQEEYDRVSSELRAIESQLASLQEKIAEAELLQAKYEELSKQYVTAKSERETIQAKYDELSTQYEEVDVQFGTVKSELETMQANHEELSAQHEELNSKYEELSKKYEEVTAEPAEISEKDIEQALFELINQARRDNGITELIWGDNIYKWAMGNSRTMATSKRREYSSYASWQDIHWATGYGTANKTANATFIIWQGSLQYERNILNNVATYGAVAVLKSGEIYYITYIASPWR